MRGLQISVLVIFFQVFTVFSETVDSELLNCSPTSLSFDISNGQKVEIKNPIVYFKYNRKSVGIYQYPGTPSVNVFINDTGIAIKGEVDSNNTGANVKNHKFFVTEVLGVANLVNVSDHSKGLKDCAFFISDKPTGSFYNELPLNLDATVFQLVEQCLTSRLCAALGAVSDEDLARARADPRDFGPMSIWSKSIQSSFPKIITPKLTENNLPKKRANLVDAADSIVRSVAELFQYQSNGQIDIPDIKQRIFSASKGTFDGLQNLQRDQSIQVRASPVSNNIQTFSFAFGIPEGHVVYNDYKAQMRLMPFVGSLCADVENVMFTATVQMDFSQKYCRPSLTDFDTLSTGASKSYTCGRLSFLTNPIMRWFVNAWDNDIVVDIERRVEWAMAAYIFEKFDCENFRPSA